MTPRGSRTLSHGRIRWRGETAGNAPRTLTMYTLGIDFGTNSVRALVVRCADGAEHGSCVVAYPSGRQGILLDPRDHNLARQHPRDYLKCLVRSVRGALAAARAHADFDASRVAGMGVGSTGSSPLPVDAHNAPLASSPTWKKNLHAQCWLWKDHTSWREAERITELAAAKRPHFIAKCGSTYSAEWFWAKLWHCRNVAPDVFAAAFSWVELCDWVPAVLAGVTDPRRITRGICAAGHKALYSDEWGGLPDKQFLAMLDPQLAALRDHLYEQAYDASTAAGELSPAWARKLGLPAGIPIAIGALDVHYGAIGCGVREGTLVKVIGTSACDCAVVSTQKPIRDIPGICGIVPGAILPGCYGIEAGQSAVGDIFKWWVEVICRGDTAMHQMLTKEATRLAPGQSGLLALDWHNGNRTILVDPLLSGALLGCTLHTTQAEVYRALIEATAFGARAILERLKEYGITTDRIVCAGGIAEKNPLLMQIYADVTGCTMRVSSSSQTCALGAAVTAAVHAGAHDDFRSAQRKMTSLNPLAYRPRAANRRRYDELYRLYRSVHDAFGGLDKSADLSGLMRQLRTLKTIRHS